MSPLPEHIALQSLPLKGNKILWFVFRNEFLDYKHKVVSCKILCLSGSWEVAQFFVGQMFDTQKNHYWLQTAYVPLFYSVLLAKDEYAHNVLFSTTSCEVHSYCVF